MREFAQLAVVRIFWLLGAARRSGILVGHARDWIAAHRAELTLSLRITVAGLIALAMRC